MKRVMTYVIAAVFAWCLFIVLPDRAMNRASAFSDGNRIAETVTRTDAPHPSALNLPPAALDINYLMPVKAGNFDIPNTNFIEYGTPETEESQVRQTFDLPPNLRRPDDEPDTNNRATFPPRFVLEL